MPFVAFKCCDTDQEEFIFPDEVDSRKTTNGMFDVQCDKCGQLHSSKPLMNMSLGRLPASYNGKTVKEVDKVQSTFSSSIRASSVTGSKENFSFLLGS